MVLHLVQFGVRQKELNEACEQPLQEGDLKAVEKELARGVGAEELGIALMWACSSGQVCSQLNSAVHWRVL